jgi:DnaK suppressor protein
MTAMFVEGQSSGSPQPDRKPGLLFSGSHCERSTGSHVVRRCSAVSRRAPIAGINRIQHHRPIASNPLVWCYVARVFDVKGANMTLTNTGIQHVSTQATHGDIRRMLVKQRCELLDALQSTMRNVREEGTGGDHQATSLDETSEGQLEHDLTFALIQMKGQVLRKVNEAIQRLHDGTYGYCVECAEAIAPARLRALPFAVRCKDCEEIREHAERRARIRPARLLSMTSFDTGL